MKKITINTIEIQRTIRDYNKQLYAANKIEPRRNGHIFRKVQSSKTE